MGIWTIGDQPTGPARPDALALETLLGLLASTEDDAQTDQLKDYERAVILLMDLHDLAVRQEDETGFQLTMEELRKTHAAKGAFLRRMAKANL